MPVVRRVLAVLGAGVLAAIVTGVPGGAMWRALMRVIALARHEPTSFSAAGTAAIIVVSVVAALPGALLLAALVRQRWLGYLVAALLIAAPNLAQARADGAEPPPADMSYPLYYTAAGAYLAVIGLQVVMLGRVSRWLRRGFGPPLATASALP
jgi:hypothetical protein